MKDRLSLRRPQKKGVYITKNCTSSIFQPIYEERLMVRPFHIKICITLIDVKIIFKN